MSRIQAAKNPSRKGRSSQANCEIKEKIRGAGGFDSEGLRNTAKGGTSVISGGKES